MTIGIQTGIDASRRSFLRGRVSAAATVRPPLRPPWSFSESAFISRCTRCGECQSACPTRVVVIGDGGYATVDFKRGECTFCGACVTACVPQALARTEGAAPWHLRAIVGDACLAKGNVVCRSCGDVCEIQAIRFRPRLGGSALPEIDLERCSGCGACVAPCPAAAIGMRTMEQPGVRA